MSENPSIQAASKEAEEAKIAGERAAARFRSIEESQRRKLPLTPEQTLGRRVEEVKTRKVPVEQLQGFQKQSRLTKPARPKQQPAKSPAGKRGGGRRIRIFGPLLVRQPHASVRLKENTPANISRAEKDSTLKRLDRAIAEWSRKYTFRIVHGGTPQEKQEAAVRLRELQAEREAVASMKPLGLPEHIRRAEYVA